MTSTTSRLICKSHRRSRDGHVARFLTNAIAFRPPSGIGRMLRPTDTLLATNTRMQAFVTADLNRRGGSLHLEEAERVAITLKSWLRGVIHRGGILCVIEMAGARSEAVAVFRSLLRTRKQCFAGDPDMLAASAKHIREEFDANRNVGPGEELENLLNKAREGIEYMRVNIVQAKLNERGNYEVKLKQEHQGGELEPV